MIYKFDNSHSPVIRCNFEGDLLEQSGNALHLTGASAIFRRLYENVQGLAGGAVVNRNGVSDSLLRIFGDVTVQVLLVLRAAPSSNYLLAFQASGDTEATNYAWSVQLANQNQLAYFSEHGAGLDDSFTTPVSSRGLPAIGVPFLLTMRRASGVVSFFVDGEPFGPPSAVLNTPTGATTSQLVLNQNTSTAFDVLGLEVVASALSDAQIRATYDATLGEEFGTLVQSVRSLWVGGLGTGGATVAARLDLASDSVRLAVTGPGGTVHSTPVATTWLGPQRGFVALLPVTGRDPDTEYSYQVQESAAAIAGAPSGRFLTAPSGASSFTVAFSGDAANGSNHAVFDAIRAKDPLLFIHLGDAHYQNIATNDPLLYHAAYDEMLSSPRASQFFRELPVEYAWDDHDYSNNNSNGSAASRPAATSCFRLRVPSHPLVEAGPNGSIYRSFDVGRVRFVITDQRSAASANSATDNASKSMLGATQKTWFKDLLSNSSGMLIVWCCPRVFYPPATAGADSWGGFSTERAEIVDHIHTHCPGRVVVLSADMHALGIDDGTNHDFLSGGGEPIPTFQASPLDVDPPAGTGTFSEGLFTNNGQFGTMEVTDTGEATIGVTWKGWDSTGALLASHAFTVSV